MRKAMPKITVIDGFILAAGLGTRMGPLSVALPKPAWTLRGKPLLQWGAESMRGAGMEHLACNAHLHPDKLKCAMTGFVGLQIFMEPLLMGSAGGLLHARGKATDPLAVWNGDALAEVPWVAFREAHLRSGADLSWLLVPHPGGPWTQVWLDKEGRVLPSGVTGQGPFLFTGASFWSSRALALLPNGPSDTRDLLPKLAHHAGVVVPPFSWREIGTPDALIVAAQELAPGQEGRIPGCYIHPSAVPQGQLRRCVLGPGARPHPAMVDHDALWFEESGQQVRLGLKLRLS